MIRRLRAWLFPPRGADPSAAHLVRQFRAARSEAITQKRASIRVQRMLRALADPGIDYSNVNERAFGRLPREERQ